MKTSVKLLIFLAAALFTTGGFARNTIASYSIKDALTSSQAQQVNLGTAIKFYFGTKVTAK